VLADVVVVRREDDARPFQRQDARRLHVAAVGADHDAERQAATLEDRKLAAPLVERHVGERLAVGTEQLPSLRYESGIVEVLAALLIEAGDHRGAEVAGLLQEAADLGAVHAQRMPARRFLAVEVAGQAALREADDLYAARLRPLQPA